MSGSLIRQKLSAFACRVEATKGVDVIAGAANVVAGDFVTGNAEFEEPRQFVDNPSQTAGYDDAAPMPGGTSAQVTVNLPLVGSGAPGTPPEWGRLLRACRYEEVITAAAIPASAQALTAGTATTATLGAGFSAVAQAHRGMPLLLPTRSNEVAQILDYTAGRVATLGQTFAPALSGTDTAQIPVHVLYRPTSSQASEVSLTAYCFYNGLLHIMTGAMGTWSIQKRSGQPAFLQVRLQGVLVARAQLAAVPASYAPLTRTAPMWIGGRCQVMQTAVEAQQMSFDAAVRLTMPDNPESANGYSAPEIIGASPVWATDPLQRTGLTPARLGAMASGQPFPLFARWGTLAGNRFCLGGPSNVVSSPIGQQSRNGLLADTIQAKPDTVGAAAFLACF